MEMSSRRLISLYETPGISKTQGHVGDWWVKDYLSLVASKDGGVAFWNRGIDVQAGGDLKTCIDR